MKKLILLMLAGLLVTGCATQDANEQGKAAVEQRDLLETQRKAEDEEARRRTQAAKDQDELNRKLDEERRRQAEAEAKAKSDAEIKALENPAVVSSALSKDAASQLKDPASPVSKRSVYYDFDRFDIREEFNPLIEAHANFLGQNKSYKIRVEGNCDERGSTEYNLALGQRRADSVKRALTVLGVPADRIEAVSYGEEKPKAKGQDEDSYAENRRSDIVYPGSE
ncbi:MAG: peptidoglycan-associated lipoprotein Pal [Burkholderiales bacterium]